MKILDTVTNLEYVSTISKAFSDEITQSVMWILPSVIEDIIASGEDLWIVVTEETQKEYNLSTDRVRINLNNCRGYTVHETGTIDADISVNGRGGWYTFTKESYKFLGVSMGDQGKLIEVTSLVAGSMVEKIVNGVGVSIREKLGTLQNVLGSSEEVGDSNVIRVDFGKKKESITPT